MSEPRDLIAATESFIRERLAGDSSGHDWWHIHRVRNNAIAIARAEGADAFVSELAALLHDVADWKFHGGDDTAGPRAAREWLTAQSAEAAVIDRVCDIIAGVSFKGAGVTTDMPTIEGRCVQDADRLDALGAIGIGRAFAFGGHFGRLMYDPDHPPQSHATFAEYKSKSGPTINHFYEKLLLLKDRMQTPTGRRMAAERHAFMEEFLARFLREWDGVDDGVTC
ncbi:MAG TPA: HD domain-containing protein [Planctomycetaceae bacterium]|nr:HD domain-containing protein [Planctomycetaceae bacterium]